MEVGKYFLSSKTKAAHNLCPLLPSALFIPQTDIIPCIFIRQRQAKHLANTQVSATLKDLNEGLDKLSADLVANHKNVFWMQLKILIDFPKQIQNKKMFFFGNLQIMEKILTTMSLKLSLESNWNFYCCIAFLVMPLFSTFSSRSKC